MSPLPIAYDVATALLSVVLPAVPEAKLLLNSAERHVIELLGGPAAGPHASRETVSTRPSRSAPGC
jgi:hypothetical protein